MAVASLVLGILSVVIGLFGSGFNWVGIIIGVIGLVLSLILYVACVAALSGAASFLDSLA